MVLICQVISQNHVIKMSHVISQNHVNKVSYDIIGKSTSRKVNVLATPGNGNVILSRDLAGHEIKGSCDFMGGSPSRPRDLDVMTSIAPF